MVRFSVSPAFEALLPPLLQRCVEHLGPAEDPWEEAKRGSWPAGRPTPIDIENHRRNWGFVQVNF